MITRIELSNFMSHERTVIEPSPGLTVLVGPNNCGKSAVVAALQILCNNADSTYVTRHGAKECSVRVETDDGHLIEWRRKTSPSYRINGEKFDRLGRNNVPDQLLRLLRLPRVEVGEDLFDVHFGEQKSPIFLLDRPASHAAKFFASSSDVDRFLKMQDLHKEKVTNAKSEKQRLELESVTLNRELSLLEPVVVLDKRLEQSEKDYRELRTLAQSIDQLIGDFAEIRRQTTAVEHCAARLTSLADLSSPPALEAAEPLSAFISELDRVRRLFTFTSEQATALCELQPSPRLEDADSLARLRQELADAHRLVDRCNNESTLLASVHVPPEFRDDMALESAIGQLMAAARQRDQDSQTANLLFKVTSPSAVEDLAAAVELLRSLQEADAQVARYRGALALLSTVGNVAEPVDAGDLAELVNRVTLVADEVLKCADLAVKAESDYLQAKVELINWARQNGICPTCGGRIDAERLVAHLSCQGAAANV